MISSRWWVTFFCLSKYLNINYVFHNFQQCTWTYFYNNKRLFFFKEGDRRKQETVKKQEGEERKEEG